MTICLSHSGVSVHSATQASNKLFVGTVDGIYLWERSKAGEKWNIADRTLEGYHVCSLAVDSNTGLMIAGTHNGGVAISEDGGRGWKFCNEGIDHLNIFSVAMSTVKGKVKLYAGTEPAHMYVSEDLGASWRELKALRSAPNLGDWTFPPPPHLAHVKHITFDPHDPECIYASVEQGELLRSTDGGETWEDLLTRAGVAKEAEGDAHRVVIRPSRPNEVFMPTGFGLFRSEDKGKTWVNDKEKVPWIGYPDPMVYDPKREDVMFVAGGQKIPFFWIEAKNANARVARTRDGGKSWELVSTSLPQTMTGSIEAMSLESWSGGCGVFLGTTDGEVFYSEDDGENWALIADGMPAISKGMHHLLAKGLVGGPPPGVTA